MGRYSRLAVPLALVVLIVASGVGALMVLRFSAQASPSRSQDGTATATDLSGLPGAPVTPTPIIRVTNRRLDPASYQAGAMVLAYGSDAAFDANVQRLLDRLASMNVNSVGLVFPLYTDGWTSSSVHTGPQTLSDWAIGTFAREAHRRGFTVILRPLLDEQSLMPSGQWRGSIRPRSVGAWFQSYQTVMVHFAQLASDKDIEMFDVGDELNSMEGYPTQWRSLIAALRTVFSGQITYSVNWGNGYPSGFASSLDFLSVDAFYPLAVSPAASTQQLAAAWQPWVAQLRGIAAASHIPVVLTELGTTSQVGSFQRPYVWNHATPVDLDAQARYYAASCQALKGVVTGLYWWAIDVYPLSDPTHDRGFSPLGKPAAAQISTCFTR